MAMGTLPPTSDQLNEISRVRKQRITYLPLDGTKRKIQTVLTLEISLRAFSQALLVTPGRFPIEGFPAMGE
jgi:hypothetical protein